MIRQYTDGTYGARMRLCKASVPAPAGLPSFPGMNTEAGMISCLGCRGIKNRRPDTQLKLNNLVSKIHGVCRLRKGVPLGT